MKNNFKNIEPEINFKNVIKNPLRLFGTIYPYFIILLIAGGLFWLKNYGTSQLNEVPYTILPNFGLPELETKRGSVLEGINIYEVAEPTQELISKGGELYKANCASCHGEQGKGDGIAGSALNPLPRDFTSTENWKNGGKLSEMYKTLEEGIPGTGMVAYEYLPINDRIAIIHFVHTLMSDYPKDTKEDLALLDETYSLSEGRMTPNQIPISEAITLISNETEIKLEKLNKLYEIYINNKNEPGNIIFENITDDTKAAMYILYNSTIWQNNPSSLINVISASLPNEAFNASALRLTENEAQMLHSYLLKLFLVERT